MPEEKNPLSRAYLLRCWQEREVIPGQTPRWRFRVEDLTLTTIAGENVVYLCADGGQLGDYGNNGR